MKRSFTSQTAVLGAALVMGLLLTQVVAAETVASAAYPLNTCIVSGSELGGMGDPVVTQYAGREVRFCCSGCKPKVDGSPAEYMKKIDAAIIEQQKPAYALDTCVVCGDKLGGAAVDHVVNNRLVRLCKKECVKALDENPAKYLPKLDEAIVAKQKPKYPLQTCVVSGEKLGAGAVDLIFAGRLVRLAGKAQVPVFEKNPGKYVAKLDDGGKAKQ